MLLTLCSVVYSAFRAGSNTQTFSTGGGGGLELSTPLVGASEEGGGPGDAPEGAAMDRGSGGGGKAMAEFEPVSYNYLQVRFVVLCCGGVSI